MSLTHRFGTLPFTELLEAAIRYAERGFVVLPATARAWDNARRWFRNYPGFGKAFLRDGMAPEAGETVYLPQLADTLRDIAETSGTSFYRGELAHRIVADAQANAAPLTAADLAGHTAEWVDPITIDYHGFTICQLPPNCQGVPVLQAMGILDRLGPSTTDVGAVGRSHLQLEAVRIAMTEARRHIADPAAMRVSVADLLHEDYLTELAARVDPWHARDHGYRDPHDRGTVCVTVADADGRMVALVQSLYAGSGIVVPDTAILLHNRGAAFSADPAHPNAIAPGKRPYNSNIPAFVNRAGRPVMAFGLMGGVMQPQGHVQLMLRVLDEGLNPQAAVDAPRWRIESGLGVAFEPEFPEPVSRALILRGNQLVDASVGGFGAAQVVLRAADGYLAAADPRRDSQAAGF
jgi:gamma-glutamyltranspeptidase/glutathione hydrolase